ncbi:hypothetical protein CEXT_76521 [Caerostris extrusa]|uniref:Uncharacterized protein n=1 Tax=Caerostris extrusa TaxID=172846 RepID=A0AAV4M4Y8_CAEEX|nr:hypothetical protein CEXT_76521 [Caerostris extrusa]
MGQREGGKELSFLNRDLLPFELADGRGGMTSVIKIRARTDSLRDAGDIANLKGRLKREIPSIGNRENDFLKCPDRGCGLGKCLE